MSVLEKVPTDRRRLVGALVGSAVVWWMLYSLNLPFWDWLLYDVFGMDPEARLTETLHFFLYDTVKIALLLTGIIFIVTVLRSFMSVERTRALLGGKREGVGNVMAAVLGVVTPFCSCSAVPAFIGFVAAGVPIGVTLSFLIASPLANEIAIGLLWSLFGWQIAAIYVVAGRAHRDRGRVHPRPDARRAVGRALRLRDDAARRGGRPGRRVDLGPSGSPWAARRWPRSCARSGPTCWSASGSARSSTGGYRPTSSPPTPTPTTRSASLVAVAIGVPLYSNAAGVMPLVQSLYGEGMPMGTLLAFMMSVVALSPARDDPAAPRAQAEADRRLRRGRGHGHRPRRLPVQRTPRVGPT